MILAILVALSLPMALAGTISVEGNFDNAVITGADGVLTGKMIFMNTEIGEIKLTDCRIRAGSAGIRAGEQIAFIILGKSSIDGELSVSADLRDGELYLSGTLEVEGVGIITDGSTIKVRDCAFTGTCKRIEFAKAEDLRVALDGAPIKSSQSVGHLCMAGVQRIAKCLIPSK